MYKILFFHQSADLYGSDKVLLSLITNLDHSIYDPIVFIPCDGPLVSELIDLNIRYHIIPILKVNRKTLSIKGLLQSPFIAWKSLRAINKVVGDNHIHIVYSNTLAVLSGALWSMMKGVPNVWHVHEIIENPKIVRKLFGWLLRIFSAKIICNSYATQNVILKDQPGIEGKCTVVWNGMERKQPSDNNQSKIFRNEIGVSDSDVVVLLLGRINRWKGHSLLINAADLLEKEGSRNIHYVIIGSPPKGQEHYLELIKNKINNYSLQGKFTVLPYTFDIWSAWDACDIAVIPSTEPEPFGMVALEAMLSKKPIIASDHGGLTEIIKHKETGLLFKPNDNESLSQAIKYLVKYKDTRMRYGENGYQRAIKEFSLQKYVSGISNIFKEMLE